MFRDNKGITAGIVALVVIVLLVLGFGIHAKYHTRYQVATVTDKERVCTGTHHGSSSCKYLIFTDHGTYEDTDSLINGKFNSSDVYGQLQDGKTYRFHLQGYRFGLTSSYPNIIGFTAN